MQRILTTKPCFAGLFGCFYLGLPVEFVRQGSDQMSFSMLRALAKTLDPLEKSQIDLWIDFSANFSLDFPKINSSLAYLNNHLATRAFCLPSFGLADVLLFGALKACPIWIKSTPTTSHTALLRWYNHIASLNFVRLALADLEKAKQNQKDRSDKGSMAIPLPDAEMGQVVTRFPPEPSGYLHIGHAKAAMLNEYFAREYKGKLIIRFDDTNPSKEKLEYQDSIKEDLLLLGIKGDVITHTSDHFKELYQHAIRLIKLGKAYVDDTNQETMRAERFDGIDGKNRNMSIEDTLTRFEEMAQGTERVPCFNLGTLVMLASKD